MRSLLKDWFHRPTHVRMWRLAIPMIASNLSMPLVSLVDSVVAGHLPHTEQLGAVAVGSGLYALLISICGFLRMGTTGFAAEAAGLEDNVLLRGVLYQALLLALTLAVAIMLFGSPFLPAVLKLMKPDTKLDDLVSSYLRIRLLGLPAALVNYVLVGWYLGTGKASMALRITLVTNLVNIALNLILVLGLQRGVDGIALASVIGEWSGVSAGLYSLMCSLRQYPGDCSLAHMRHWIHWQPVLAVNRDMLIRNLALQAVFFAIIVLGTRLGNGIVAANALLFNGLLVTSFGLDGLANAIEALSGHALGQGNGLAMRRTLVVSAGWSLLASLLLALFFAVFGRIFINLQTSITAVRDIAYTYLPYLAVLPLGAVWSYLLDGLFVGTHRGREMRNSILFASSIFALLGSSLHPWGNHGLWLAFLGFMLVRAATMAYYARRITQQSDWMPVNRPSAH